VGRSERPGFASDADASLTRETIAAALSEAQVLASKLDVLEVHDAFTIEELLYTEAAGLCAEGSAVKALLNGEFDIGGRCAVSPSGGLIAMGHPIGPTGIGQIGELTIQLRREAGVRQQPNARVGLAHMVGLGSVCYAHVLTRDA
jgi:acetyl-CoA acetyltransferase